MLYLQLCKRLEREIRLATFHFFTIRSELVNIVHISIGNQAKSSMAPILVEISKSLPSF